MVSNWNRGDSQMPTITLKNIPGRLYERLKQSASSNRRSINGEAIVCIEKAVVSQRVDPEDFLIQARRMREKFKGHPVSDGDFTRAKSEGRV